MGFTIQLITGKREVKATLIIHEQLLLRFITMFGMSAHNTKDCENHLMGEKLLCRIKVFRSIKAQ